MYVRSSKAERLHIKAAPCLHIKVAVGEGICRCCAVVSGTRIYHQLDRTHVTPVLVGDDLVSACLFRSVPMMAPRGYSQDSNRDSRVSNRIITYGARKSAWRFLHAISQQEMRVCACGTPSLQVSEPETVVEKKELHKLMASLGCKAADSPWFLVLQGNHGVKLVYIYRMLQNIVIGAF
jgi:hypothetical protein